MTVEIDFTTIVDPFKIDVGLLQPRCGGIGEMLAIPSYAAGEITGAACEVGE